MKNYSIIAFFILTSFYFFSCQNDEIVIPTPCLGPGNLPYHQAKLELYTDIITTTIFSIQENGFFKSDSISIKSNNTLISAEMSGYICKEYKATVNIRYINSSDNSLFKIETYQSYDHILGKIYWCPNTNNQCSYTEIGSLLGLVGGNHGGTFTTPLFYGSYRVYLN